MISANCRHGSEAPICTPCWKVVDMETAEDIKQAWTAEQPAEWAKDLYKYCSARWCWNIIQKKNWQDPVPYCKSCTEPIPVVDDPYRSWNADPRPSGAYVCKEEPRDRSRSRSRSPRPQMTQAVQRDARMMTEMMRPLLDKIIERQMETMQVEMNQLLTFVEGFFANNEAGSSSRHSYE